MNRNLQTELKYREYVKKTKNIPCVFCPPSPDQIIKELKYFWILKNTFPYSIWDYRQVEDHLMIVPKKHITNMIELPPSAKKEYVDTISNYEIPATYAAGLL